MILKDRGRVGLFAICILISLPGYLLINRWALTAEPVSILTALDRSIPFTPAWEHVYVAYYLFLALPFAVVADLDELRRYTRAFLATQVVAWAVFVIYPVRMHRPEGGAVDSFATWILRVNHALDAPTNCLPSLHVSNALLAALAVWRIDRVLGGAAVVGAMAVAASTLFAKHHYVFDVVAATALAGAGYALFLGFRPKPQLERMPRRWLVGLLSAHAIAVAVAYALYRRSG